MAGIEEQPQNPSEPVMLNKHVMYLGDHKWYGKEGGMSGEAAEIDLKCHCFGFANDVTAPWRAVGLMFKKVLINLTKEKGWKRLKLAAVSSAYIVQDSNFVKDFVS